MNSGPELLLIGAVAAVGVLHTIVPDHWASITLIARQRGWSKAETARASLQAGIGHVLSTLLIASVVWLAGVAVATRFGHVVDTAASIALVAFGGWIGSRPGANCAAVPATDTLMGTGIAMLMTSRTSAAAESTARNCSGFRPIMVSWSFRSTKPASRRAFV
jgi:hypothetical protein